MENELLQNWYYKIEVESGNYTPGRPIGTLSTVRKFFAQIDLAGATVLDIGTQEFVAPMLLAKQQPKEIVAYDRLSMMDRFTYLSNFYDLSKTTYVHGMPLHFLRDAIEKQNLPQVYDFVNFTGVLYHMADPLVGLAIGRSFLRTNGIMLLETSVSTADSYSAECNHHATLYKGSNYFQISLKTLDYWCRMLKMKVLDVVWQGGDDIKRAFLVLRAVDRVVAEREDRWIRKSFLTEDFKAFGLSYDRLMSEKEEVPYTPLTGLGALKYTNTKPRYVDVFETVNTRRRLKVEREKCILNRADEV